MLSPVEGVLFEKFGEGNEIRTRGQLISLITVRAMRVRAEGTDIRSAEVLTGEQSSARLITEYCGAVIQQGATAPPCLSLCLSCNWPSHPSNHCWRVPIELQTVVVSVKRAAQRGEHVRL